MGLIGCGGFGKFCLKSYVGLKQIRVAAVADVNENALAEVAADYGLETYMSARQLIRRSDLDLIHISTPPFTHFSLGKEVLEAGKHLICEKPLALSLKEADQMLRIARVNRLIAPVNFILRYVPLVETVKQIIQSGILGKPLRAYFENYAADEKLNADHWFWDKTKSGGIFVEHGVHFFDLYRYWFGEARLLFSHTESRPLSGQEDRAFCVLRHKSGVLSTHYHGFNQALAMDRATHRVLLERGDLTINGWIPESLTIDALVDDTATAELQRICPGADLKILQKFDPDRREIIAGGKSFHATHRILLNMQSALSKQTLYSAAIKDLILDQIAHIENAEHRRRVTEENGREALALALMAARFSSGEIRLSAYNRRGEERR